MYLDIIIAKVIKKPIINKAKLSEIKLNKNKTINWYNNNIEINKLLIVALALTGVKSINIWFQVGIYANSTNVIKKNKIVNINLLSKNKKAKKCSIIFKNINRDKLFSHPIFHAIFEPVRLQKIQEIVAIQTTILQI